MNKLTLALYVLIIFVLIYEIVSASAADDDVVMMPSMPGTPAASGSVSPGTAQQDNVITPAAGTRDLGAYRDITTDTSSFDLNEAQEKAKRAFESNDMYTQAPTVPPSRTNMSAPGNSDAATNSITGGVLVRPIVDNVLPPAPIVVNAPVSAGPTERPDNRCGPAFGRAKCGPGRCCSIYGWCGSPGEPHCMRGVNVPEYNGYGGALPAGLSNNTIVKCNTGEIYKIENSQKRLYPTLSVYEKHGSPPFTNIDCAVLNSIVPGTSFS